MMVTLAIATVLFQRSYTVRVDKYLSQICDSVAAGYKAQPTHDAVTLANLLPESDTSLRFTLMMAAALCCMTARPPRRGL